MKYFKLVVTLFVMITLTFSGNVTTEASTKQLEVHYINVGQGDSILVKAPNGKTMLIDGGDTDKGTTVVNYLKKQNVKKLDYVVATHPDSDHIGGLHKVISTFPVSQYIDSGKVHTSKTYENLMKLVKQKKISYNTTKSGKTYQLDKDMVTKVLYSNSKAKDNNDASIVLSLKYKNQSFLLMGDAGFDVEYKLVTEGLAKHTHLKVGHHGSDTSTTDGLLKAVKPKTAVISVGKTNKYSHPSKTTVDKLNKTVSKVYTTASHCNIVTKTDGKTDKTTTNCTTNVKDTKIPVKSTQNNGVKQTTQPDKVQNSKSTQVKFKNCTEMRKVYPNGVQKGHESYEAKHDRDKDNWSCEK